MPRTLLIVTLTLLLLRVALEVQDARREPLLRWRDAHEALTESARSGRPVLYDFSADWCRPCKRMDRELFSDPEAVRFIEARFVPVRVEDGRADDGLTDAEAEALRDRLGVRAFPTLLVVEDGRELLRQAGYPGRDQTLVKLRSSVD